MAGGIYNETYFDKNPEQASAPGFLYCVVLVNKATNQRECLKIGITKGKNWKNVIARSHGFKGYEARILKVVHGTLENVYHLEQYLHEKWRDKRYLASHKFGGHTELFELTDEIVKSIPATC